MADTRQTPRDATEPAAPEPETTAATDSRQTAGPPAEATEPEAGTPDATSSGDGEGTPSEKTPDQAGDAPKAGDDTSEAADETPEAADNEPGKPDATSSDEGSGTGASSADASELPYPTRVGWVVAAFLLFWPLAIPALVHSMRTVEANGTGNVRRAKKSSLRTLDFSVGAVAVGAVGIVGLAIGLAAAPTYAASLPPELVSTARSFVPPALAGPLGLTPADDGPVLTAPTPSATPVPDGGATAEPYQDPYADPYAEDPATEPDVLPTPDRELDLGEDPGPSSDTTATAGAEIPDLQVGDCFDTAATAGQSTLYRIPVVPCTTAHGGEIYAETTAPDSLGQGGEPPTQQALWDAADAYCYPQFARFVGRQWAKSELLYWPIAPSEESWAEGDRRVLCVVESEELVTGSLEGAER